MVLNDTISTLGNAIINFINRKIVTSISASSTDTTVPSAKCVYDYHDSTKQDVISDLATIRAGASKGATALQSYTETDPLYTADKPNIANVDLSNITEEGINVIKNNVESLIMEYDQNTQTLTFNGKNFVDTVAINLDSINGEVV